MSNLQKIDNQQSKYEEIIEYLKQDNEYWLKNDKWDFYNNFKYNLDLARGKKYLDFSVISNHRIVLELKYSLLFGLKNKYFQPIYIIIAFQAFLRKIEKYIIKYNITSITDIEVNMFKFYLINAENLTEVSAKSYIKYLISLSPILIEFYDDREETEKDIWHANNIIGIKVSASNSAVTKPKSINFSSIPVYYKTS